MDALVGRGQGHAAWPARRRRPGRTPGRGSGPRASITSKPIVRPVSRHSAFSGPWTANGMAPAATARAERGARTGRRAGRRAPAGRRLTSAPSSREPGQRRAGRPTSGRTPAAATPTARASVAAASAALPHEAMASARSLPATGATPSRSAASRCSRMPTRCRALWLPATLPVSSFTQHAAIAREPQGLAQRGRERAKGVTAEADAVDRRDGLVEASAPARPDRRRPSRGPRRTPPRRSRRRRPRAGSGRRRTAPAPGDRHAGTGRGGGRLRRAFGQRHGHGVAIGTSAPQTAQR